MAPPVADVRQPEQRGGAWRTARAAVTARVRSATVRKGHTMMHYIHSHTRLKLLQESAPRDRRIEPRRPCHAGVWLLDADVSRAVEIGAAVEISRTGATLLVPRLGDRAESSLRAGSEHLVIFDDPTGREPLADQRVALVRIIRTSDQSRDLIRVACLFAARSLDHCTTALPRGRRSIDPDMPDTLAGDALEEVVDRVWREIVAASPPPHRPSRFRQP